MDLFKKKDTSGEDFGYLASGEIYFDSACQTLRPRSVIDAQTRYFEEYGACGGRVQYDWGKKLDGVVTSTRDGLLKYLKKSSKKYFVAFTQNTTYAINLLLSQIQKSQYEMIVTTDIEHNSVFLPSISYGKKNDWVRQVLSRNEDGTVDIASLPKKKMIFIANTVSNIDGRQLSNIKEVCEHVHSFGGIVVVDAAQSMVHHLDLLNIDYDILCASAHKMYAPSLGILVVKKSILSDFSFGFVGGGMVQSVSEHSYELLPYQNEPWAMFEPGLQNWASIVGLHTALEWLSRCNKNHLHHLETSLWSGLTLLPGVVLLNQSSGAVVSFYIEGMDSHRVAQALATQGIMLRSGYFCCHYYLQGVKNLPPLLRISLGLHNTEEDIRQLISKLTILLNAR